MTELLDLLELAGDTLDESLAGFVPLIILFAILAAFSASIKKKQADAKAKTAQQPARAETKQPAAVERPYRPITPTPYTAPKAFRQPEEVSYDMPYEGIMGGNHGEGEDPCHADLTWETLSESDEGYDPCHEDQPRPAAAADAYDTAPAVSTDASELYRAFVLQEVLKRPSERRRV